MSACSATLGDWESAPLGPERPDATANRGEPGGPLTQPTRLSGPVHLRHLRWPGAPRNRRKGAPLWPARGLLGVISGKSMGAGKERGGWLLGAALACVVACGGQTRDDGGSGGASFTQSDCCSTAGSGGTLGTPRPLGTCESTGFLLNEAYGRPCNWLYEDTCYDSREDACECGCPRDQGDVICVSGSYEGPDSATEVSCIPEP
jgi:hypothetical protein